MDISALQAVITTVKPIVEIHRQVVEEQKNQPEEVKVDLPKPSSFGRRSM